ncbi:tryptophan 2,3-dioxygenase [Catenuloplanes atrovinosus]|uniref:tryptophan 2,3-dioxygenase n=1 Tax=Catenuloplanes atrovinosus TaxID=137266 RepID=UPI00286A0532|nr:tryptophan 2,3-dioxygenase family protein [Catenuloplanes atrovinosus]
MESRTAEQRDARAGANGGEPTTEFPGRIPYDAYVHAGTLHSLQRTLSGDPGEMSFLVVSQIMELYFGLTRFELDEARTLIVKDDAWGALAPLRRAALDLDGLNAAWKALSWMTPADFNRFRDLLGEGSGFQSAAYRELEFILGLKTESLIRPFRRSAAYPRLVRAFEDPSLWDETMALLARRGKADWVQVYRDGDGPDNHLRMLGEALTDVAVAFGEWRHQHLLAVRRTMGAKPGSGGSAGIAWLERSMSRVVFPELWEARTHM